MRSMGDQLRFMPEGPRELEDSDYRHDEKPKIARNIEEQQIIRPAHFEPPVDVDRHEKLLKLLDERAGTQRGKPRSQDPKRNPSGVAFST